MEEYLDLVDENNVLTGEKKPRSEIHSQGFWHRTVHIYVYRKVGDEIEFLVHLRAKHKDLKPNCWDTRFGGHIKSGETLEATTKSELMEEVGISLDPQNLIQGEIYKTDKFPNREFTYAFYYEFDGDISTLKFNDGEVQEIKWMKLSDIVEGMTTEADKWSGGKMSITQVFEVLKDKFKK